MTATHNALLGALSRHAHFSEFSDYLNVGGNILTPAQRRALAMLNLTNDFLYQAPSGLFTPGLGISAGVGTVTASEQVREGRLFTTRFYIDLTGLASSTTDLDVIGVAGGPAILGQVTTALHGLNVSGRVICAETPAGGVTDIDLYSATVATAVFDDAIAPLVETAHVTSGGAWVAGLQKPFTLAIPANNYLYLTCGAAGTPATYTAGRFIIEIEGSSFVGT